MSKRTILNDFIIENASLPAQGSDAWKQNRFSVIGGSEISTLIRKNKNKTLNALVMEKLGHTVFNGNVITHWGNVFEEVIRLYANNKFNCNIVETGSIQYPDGYLSYSPDGLAVINKVDIQDVLDIDLCEYGLDPTHPEYLVLFEFKCPHSRVPTNDVPEYYLPQVKIGMNIINFLEIGIFIQAVFRRCKLKDIAYNDLHNEAGHFKRAVMDKYPIGYGYMFILTDDIDTFEYTEDLLNQENTITYNGMYDIGSIYDKELLEYILGSCVNKTFTIHYACNELYNEYVFESNSFTREMHDISLSRRLRMSINDNAIKYAESGKYVIGVMAYKLMSVYTSTVEKTDTYISDNNIHQTAKRVIEFIGNNRNLDKAVVKKNLKILK